MFCFEAENQKVSIKMIKHSGTSLHVLAIDEEPFPTKHFLAIDHAPFPYCGFVACWTALIGFVKRPRQIKTKLTKQNVCQDMKPNPTPTRTPTPTPWFYIASLLLTKHFLAIDHAPFPYCGFCLTFWTDLLCGFVKWPRPIKKRTQTERTNSHTWLYIQQLECQTSYYQQCPDILRSDSSKNHHICDQRSLSQLSKTCLHNDLQEHWSQRV